MYERAVCESSESRMKSAKRCQASHVDNGRSTKVTAHVELACAWERARRGGARSAPNRFEARVSATGRPSPGLPRACLPVDDGPLAHTEPGRRFLLRQALLEAVWLEVLSKGLGICGERPRLLSLSRDPHERQEGNAALSVRLAPLTLARLSLRGSGRWRVTARAARRLLRTSRTIADLEGESWVEAAAMAEALGHRRDEGGAEH